MPYEQLQLVGWLQYWNLA